MNKDTIKLKIITQQKIVYEDEVEAFYTNAEDGMMGVLPNHTPLVSALKIGVTKAIPVSKNSNDAKSEPVFITTMGGILQFKDNLAVILTDLAELGTDIDETRAKAAYERAKAKLAAHTEKTEILRAQFALAKAIARITAASRGR